MREQVFHIEHAFDLIERIFIDRQAREPIVLNNAHDLARLGIEIDGDHFRKQFAEDNMKNCDDRKSYNNTDGMKNDRRSMKESKQRRENRRRRRLANPAKGEAREGNADLRGSKILAEVDGNMF